MILIFIDYHDSFTGRVDCLAGSCASHDDPRLFLPFSSAFFFFFFFFQTLYVYTSGTSVFAVSGFNRVGSEEKGGRFDGKIAKHSVRCLFCTFCYTPARGEGWLMIAVDGSETREIPNFRDHASAGI